MQNTDTKLEHLLMVPSSSLEICTKCLYWLSTQKTVGHVQEIHTSYRSVRLVVAGYKGDQASK